MPIMHLADLIREKVPPGANTITPSAQIVRYLSDRERDHGARTAAESKRPATLSRTPGRARIAYAAFPAKIYQDKEPMLAQLVKHGVITEGRGVGVTTDGIRLSQAVIVIPAGRLDQSLAPAPRRRRRQRERPGPRRIQQRPRPNPQPKSSKPPSSAGKSTPLRRRNPRRKKRKKKHPATTSTTRLQPPSRPNSDRPGKSPLFIQL